MAASSELRPDFHHYTECGLDYVWLADGFVHEDTAAGPVVTVSNPSFLDCSIAMVLINHRRRLTGQDAWFILSLLDLIPHRRLSYLLGIDVGSIEQWAKSKAPIHPVEDRALRQIFLEEHDVNQPFTETLKRVSSIDTTFDRLLAQHVGKCWSVGFMVGSCF